MGARERDPRRRLRSGHHAASDASGARLRRDAERALSLGGRCGDLAAPRRHRRAGAVLERRRQSARSGRAVRRNGAGRLPSQRGRRRHLDEVRRRIPRALPDLLRRLARDARRVSSDRSAPHVRRRRDQRLLRQRRRRPELARRDPRPGRSRGPAPLQEHRADHRRHRRHVRRALGLHDAGAAGPRLLHLPHGHLRDHRRRTHVRRSRRRQVRAVHVHARLPVRLRRPALDVRVLQHLLAQQRRRVVPQRRSRHVVAARGRRSRAAQHDDGLRRPRQRSARRRHGHARRPGVPHGRRRSSR